MKRLALILVLSFVALAGCVSPAALPAGATSCSTVNSMYGKASTVAANADDVRKGATSKGKTVITCGEATLTIETDVGVATPPAK